MPVQRMNGGNGVITPATSPIEPLGARDFQGLHETMKDIIHYRKSGLSLNHIVGCPLECAYCIRHAVGAYNIKQPHLLCKTSDAIEALINHPYFRRDITPIQFLNKASDPFLPSVLPHTFEAIDTLDRAGLHNHFLIITRYHVSEDDCVFLNRVKNLRLTLLITHSGLNDNRLEPINSRIPEESLKTAFNFAENYKVIHYWRPLIPGLNDSPQHIEKAVELSRHSHATVFTGLYYKDEMKSFFQEIGLPELYENTARRKILPEALENIVLAEWARLGGPRQLFRKTSCGVAFAHGVADYNGHYSINEICDICPDAQVETCARSHAKPKRAEVQRLAAELGHTDLDFSISDRAVTTTQLDESPRYFLQHQLNYQVHDSRYPHLKRRHGRSDIGWK